MFVYTRESKLCPISASSDPRSSLDDGAIGGDAFGKSKTLRQVRQIVPRSRERGVSMGSNLPAHDRLRPPAFHVLARICADGNPSPRHRRVGQEDTRITLPPLVHLHVAFLLTILPLSVLHFIWMDPLLPAPGEVGHSSKVEERGIVQPYFASSPSDTSVDPSKLSEGILDRSISSPTAPTPRWVWVGLRLVQFIRSS